MTLRRQLIIVALGAVALGAVGSGLLTSAAVSENLSGDFANQETGKVYVGFTAVVFLTWSAFFAAPIAIIGSAAVFALFLLGRRRGRPD